MTFSDPTLEPSRFAGLFAVLARIDADILELYADRGQEKVRSRFVMPLLRLAGRGPLTIKELADELGRTHSALSQTVAQMRSAGLVDSAPGPDGRTRVVTLTMTGRELVPLAAAEWRATEAALARLEEELPYPPSHVAADLAEALDRRPFRDRLEDELEDVLDPGAGR